MTRPAIAYFRWPHHGDLRAVIERADGPLFFAEDVCELLELEVPEARGFWGGIVFEYPGRLSRVEGFDDDALEHIWLYTAEDLRFVAENFPTYMSIDFLRWFGELLSLLNPDGTYLEPPAPIEEDAGPTFSIARAARVLSRDPRTHIGRDALFEFMRRDLGWITRDIDIWAPTLDAIGAGVLLRERLELRPGQPRQVYAQIRVTAEGIAALHRALGGTTTLQLDVTPHPTLLEI